ncbi:S-adenosylmethionine:tRNA-ribosyltransferase-isomerase (queuine synthetase) [Belliella baltica DSM 15883]|uniref:S-adenosylmethionine:tRNA ribosyltransferase-isomerase n=1 Tax=Belliella baltica (strain DSM 15883 / CIP 108006 / LMG 21964 / BA134) TaxID=866536 RepID=I3Z8Q6_BELBD|nr:S-adenosylmethionine:tRNA ribosyltransferase-isomerase [Belliella baltica]AFL85624.1 S-adenosylmethionine:tRNA-ribosyltransferase-isomerase (queuine synthetase) [Belliella baltica DSM 15883]
MNLSTAIAELKLSDYEYTLPEEKIAKFPLEKRDASKLLHFKDGKIEHLQFAQLPDLVPVGSLMVFNNTKVIPARLIFQRSTGAKIEIFLLKPIAPTTVINEVMIKTETVSWECMIGNLKKWKTDEILSGEVIYQNKIIKLNASLIDQENRIVKFTWDAEVPFVSIVEASGEVPLPPYLNRKPTEEDRPRYQTVYSKNEGAVAAPTAGLHFTDKVLQKLAANKVKEEFLTLHVGAGTFQPIKTETITAHNMHSEQVVVSISTIQNITEHTQQLIAVGTTSMRSLESLYWFGVKLLREEGHEFLIPKLYPYQDFDQLPTRKESFETILTFMKKNNLSEITGSTEIFIMPGYNFKVCDGLVTNFHQPGSTLILLIAAFTKKYWKQIYKEALENDYRFLSYGDSSLLWCEKG